MSQQPEWKTLWCTDCDLVQVDTSGVYAPEMEVADEIDEGHFCTDNDCHAYDDDEATHSSACEGKPARFEVFRFSLDRMKLVDDPSPDPGTVPAKYVVPVRYESSWPQHPSQYCEWFIEDLAAVASSAGRTEVDLIAALCSENVRTRAGAYRDIGGHHGFMNLDDYLLTLTERELDKRWAR